MIAALFALVYLYLLGYAFLIFIQFKDNFPVNFALAGLTGMGLTTILMFVLEVIGFAISPLNMILVGMLVIVLFLYRDLRRKNFSHWQNYVKIRLDWRNWNSMELSIMLVVAFLWLASFVKNMYWPVQAYDSVAGYDLMAKVISVEQTLNVSLHRFKLAGARGIYPPQIEGIFAFFYLMGSPSAKIVNSLFFLSLILLFYNICKKWTTGTAAAFFTLLLVMTPEMWAHGSLSLTNLPAATFGAGGVLFLYLWWKEQQSVHLVLSGLCLGLNTWTRSDGVAFNLAAAIVLFFIVMHKRHFLPWLYHSLLSFLPFVLWQIYLKIAIHAESTERFRHELFWDPKLLNTIFNYLKVLFFNTSLYGVVFYIFIALFLINIRYFKQNWPLLLYLFLSFIFYTIIYYQLNPEVQDSIHTMMRTSYKRAIFYYIPVVLLYSALSPQTLRFFNWVEVKYQRAILGRS